MSEAIPVACALCGRDKTQHAQLEAVGGVHHRWAASRSAGVDVVETNSPSKRPEQSQQVMIAPAPDILLRRLLRDKGVISQDEYEGLFGA